jgi:protein-S-isoprenylcysteine O-methyltransferase Ste14
MTRLGGWLFRHRTIIPAPFILAILLLPVRKSSSDPWVAGVGVGLTWIGEALRLWAVRHIGAVSRTRSERLGPLIAAGPFAVIRNPLYLGNIVIWAGFAIAARIPWLAGVIVVLLGLQYHAIVRWEEQLLEARYPDEYRIYTERVPRWIPSGNRGERGLRRSQVLFTWRETLFSERGTLIAMAVGYLLLWLKLRTENWF